jgi:hypothetical protein
MFPARWLFVLVSFALLLAGPARAQAINAEGAAKLKTVFEEIIDYQKNAAKADGRIGLEYEGEVTVEPAGSYYAVTLPHMRMIYPDASTLEIGMISVNASPHDTPGQWKMAMAMPTPMVMLDAQKKHIMRLNIGAQNSVGIWDEKLKHFAKLDSTYKNVVMEGIQPGFTIRMGEVKIRSDLTPDAAGLWSGPGFASVAGLDVDLPDTATKAHIDEIRANIDLDQYNPVLMRQYRSEQVAGTSSRAAIFGGLAKAAKGFKSQQAASGIRITKPGIDPNAAPETIAMDKAYLGLDIASANAGSVNMGVRSGYSGLALSSIPTELQSLQPTEGNFDVVFANLPVNEMSALGEETLQAGERAGVTLLMKAPAVLSQAGSTATIKETYISNKDYRIEMAGALKADAASMTGVSGDMRAAFHGLDKLLAKTQVLAADPGSKNAALFRSVSAQLETLKDLAKVETVNNSFVHVFELSIAPPGQMLLNGQNLLALMMQTQMMMGTPPAVPVPPVTPATDQPTAAP